MADDAREEFFVGYLPTPPTEKRFLLRVVIGLVAFLGVAGAIVGSMQRDPGNAVWNTSTEVQLDGLFLASPYPMVIVGDLDGRERSVLLVAEGKSGVRDFMAGMDGQNVRISGYRLDRNSFSMLELHRPPELLHDSVSPARFPASKESEQVAVLRGEIVDPKCFLGAMKPGDGKTHKACATLCIRGGIPPVLVVPDSSSPGGVIHYLLVGSDGAGLVGEKLDSLLPFVGDRVEARGTIERRGDLRLFRIEPGALRRV